MRLPLNLISGIVRLAPKIKSMFFADGKFNKARAVILIVSLVIISVLIHFFGLADTIAAVDILDDLSDVIGYSE